MIQLVKEQLAEAFVSTEAAHSTPTSYSVKRYFQNFSFLLNRLRCRSAGASRQREAHSTAIKLAVKHLGDLPFGSLPEQLSNPKAASESPA
ncbi:hypothetical protein P3W55_29640 [Pseudomonas citronellolis]|uniref:Uncharacterized protein n=1 Tax=Pseudomonas citronellolis TaxID=53408 RepID=A0AAW6PI25_9PSED|nr:hypothetical protein [Pseudomonas citronellolis]MDF3845891.1 hypothetical protein [Pseudomonas citronellolis]